MSELVPSFPVLYISETDRNNLTSKKNIFEEENVTYGTIEIQNSFTNDFEILSYELKKTNKLKQVTLTAKKINDHGLLNTTWQVGNISELHRPDSDISGLFPYGTTLTDIGQVTLSSEGDLAIKSGNDVYIVENSTFTFTLTYI